MAYIGTPPSNAFTSLLKQDFTTSVTTGYTLDHAVNNANDIALFINFVRQEPTAAYSASGTTLTLTSATASTDDMYCVYLGQALQTVNPPNSSVGTSQLDSSLDFSSKTITLASNMKNTPAFYAYISSNQDISNTTATKVQFNTEDLDTDSCYDNTTNYRFTPTVAGKYYIGTMLTQQGGTSELIESRIYIYKNGSVYSYSYQANQNNYSNYQANYQSVIMDMNGTTDYVESFAYISRNGSTSRVLAHTRGSYFMGYRLTGA